MARLCTVRFLSPQMLYCTLPVRLLQYGSSLQTLPHLAAFLANSSSSRAIQGYLIVLGDPFQGLRDVFESDIYLESKGAVGWDIELLSVSNLPVGSWVPSVV